MRKWPGLSAQVINFHRFAYSFHIAADCGRKGFRLWLTSPFCVAGFSPYRCGSFRWRLITTAADGQENFSHIYGPQCSSSRSPARCSRSSTPTRHPPRCSGCRRKGTSSEPSAPCFASCQSWLLFYCRKITGRGAAPAPRRLITARNAPVRVPQRVARVQVRRPGIRPAVQVAAGKEL